MSVLSPGKLLLSSRFFSVSDEGDRTDIRVAIGPMSIGTRPTFVGSIIRGIMIDASKVVGYSTPDSRLVDAVISEGGKTRRKLK